MAKYNRIRTVLHMICSWGTNDA